MKSYWLLYWITWIWKVRILFHHNDVLYTRLWKNGKEVNVPGAVQVSLALTSFKMEVVKPFLVNEVFYKDNHNRFFMAAHGIFRRTLVLIDNQSIDWPILFTGKICVKLNCASVFRRRIPKPLDRSSSFRTLQLFDILRVLNVSAYQ